MRSKYREALARNLDLGQYLRRQRPPIEKRIPGMTDPTDYVPRKVWTWTKASGGRFANINRPIAGPTHDKELPVGRHPFQLYSLGTPNGQKVTIMFEELLALGHTGAEYDAWLIRIGEGDQFGSGRSEERRVGKECRSRWSP